MGSVTKYILHNTIIYIHQLEPYRVNLNLSYGQGSRTGIQALCRREYLNLLGTPDMPQSYCRLSWTRTKGRCTRGYHVTGVVQKVSKKTIELFL